MLNLRIRPYKPKEKDAKPSKGGAYSSFHTAHEVKRVFALSVKGLRELKTAVLSRPVNLNPVMELRSVSKTLAELIEWCQNTQTTIEENTLILYLKNLIDELQKFHNRGIAYQFIRPENIIVEEDCSLRFVPPEMTEIKPGNVFYMPEEALSSEIRSDKELMKADLWSLGIVIGELYLLKSKWVAPYLSLNDRENVIRQTLMTRKREYSLEMIELILDLLKSDPNKRVSLKEVDERLQEILVSYIPILISNIFQE